MSALTPAEREALFPFLEELELSSLERGVEELRSRGIAVRVDILRGSLEIGYRFVTWQLMGDWMSRGPSVSQLVDELLEALRREETEARRG